MVAQHALKTTTSPKPVSNLVFFIESHCGCAVEKYDGTGSSTITVSCDTLGGIREVETIPATLNAVKDWLGY